MESGGLGSENVGSAELWLGVGSEKLGSRGGVRGLGSAELRSGGWSQESWDQGGLGSAELWLEGGVRASGEVGSRRLELGGNWGRGVEVGGVEVGGLELGGWGRRIWSWGSAELWLGSEKLGSGVWVGGV